MAKRPDRRPSRYDASGNVEAQYVDAAQTVLVNKLGISELTPLLIAEEEALALAYETLLNEVRLSTPLTAGLIQAIHSRIFGEIYDWAGRWRTVWIRKPGVTWPPPDYLDQAMTEFEHTVLRVYPAHLLQDDERFCSAVAHIQSEFLVIHPFREGNARTIKLLSNLLAAQTSRPLLKYDTSAEGINRYIVAAKAAFKRDYQPMTAVIRQALADARSA